MTSPTPPTPDGTATPAPTPAPAGSTPPTPAVPGVKPSATTEPTDGAATEETGDGDETNRDTTKNSIGNVR